MVGGRPLTIRIGAGVEDLGVLEPLWNALQAHHSRILPKLGSQTPARPIADSWDCRRRRYEAWLATKDSFFLIAEEGERAVGYAFVTVGSPFAGWTTGRLASLETLSVLPDRREAGIGSELLAATWQRLTERGVKEMSITAVITNADAHRFYERHGFEPSLVVFYGKCPTAPTEANS
jgi:GNAT superfamily N-acetyltransferase